MNSHERPVEENSPEPLAPGSETSALASEKREQLTLTPDALKQIIDTQIGEKAKINSLELVAENGEMRLNAKLDAGMIGGKISIEGSIVNDENEIAVRNLNVDARGYVKSWIEGSLSKFASAIRQYLENQYGGSVSRIQIVGSNLMVDLEGPSKKELSATNAVGSQVEHLLGIISKAKGWERTGYIDVHARDFIKQKRFDDARKVVSLIENEMSRNATLANIDKLEKNPDLKI